MAFCSIVPAGNGLAILEDVFDRIEYYDEDDDDYYYYSSEEEEEEEEPRRAQVLLHPPGKHFKLGQPLLLNKVNYCSGRRSSCGPLQAHLAPSWAVPEAPESGRPKQVCVCALDFATDAEANWRRLFSLYLQLRRNEEEDLFTFTGGRVVPLNQVEEGDAGSENLTEKGAEEEGGVESYRCNLSSSSLQMSLFFSCSSYWLPCNLIALFLMVLLLMFELNLLIHLNGEY